MNKTKKVYLKNLKKYATTGFNSLTVRNVATRRDILTVRDLREDRYHIIHNSNSDNALIGCWVYKNETTPLIKTTVIIKRQHGT